MKLFEVLARFVRTQAYAARARIEGTQDSRRLTVTPAAPAQGQLTPITKDLVDAEPPPADPSFPKLEVVKDPELMREVFQRHLQPLDGKAYRVLDCRIHYIHYRRAARCVVQYTLRIVEPETGREWSQWVSGAQYANGRTRRIWEKLQRTESARRGVSDSSPAFVPFSYIPDLDMLMQVFPYDHRFPALRLLMSGPPPELEPLLLARFGTGDWRAEAWRRRAGSVPSRHEGGPALDGASPGYRNRSSRAEALLREDLP
jgi:hypothetical protein